MQMLPAPTRSVGSNLRGGILIGAMALLGGMFVLVMIPASTGSHLSSSRIECRNNLKQLALAMHNYRDAYGAFPPAYVADKDGKPMHSWRVLLLPYMDRRGLYDLYRFDEPWDGPNNRKLAEQMPPEYHCPADADARAGETSYFVVVGPKTIFPGTASVAMSDIPDGPTYTILLVEAADSGINWLKPRDLTYDEARRGINPEMGWGISSNHGGGAIVAFADGSEDMLPNNTPVQQLRLLLERNDGRPGYMHRAPVASTAP
jgi:prepilin-type processing-associated H-X9-DG protein